MSGLERRRLALASVVVLACLAMERVASAQPATAVATLTVPGDSAEVLSNVVSLPVSSIRVAAGIPVAKDSILVEMDKAKLQREYLSLKTELERVKSEIRYRSSERDLGGSAGPNSIRGNFATAEADLTRDMLEVQTKMATADLRAPLAGYVVKHFLAAGVPAKKRKPALTFVDASKTRVEMSLAVGEYRTGDSVVVASADGVRRFRATVVEASPAASGLALVLRPEGLPFLILATPTSVTVTAAK